MPEDAIQAMVERLRSPEPVTVRGMAPAERIITDGDAKWRKGLRWRRRRPGGWRAIRRWCGSWSEMGGR
jgi:hypothetical protein